MSRDNAQEAHAEGPNPNVPEPRRRWWRIALGAGAVVLGVLAMLFLLIVLRFTSRTPATIPPSGLSPTRIADVQARWREFERREGAGQRATLTLNGPELHALLQSRFGLSDRVATRIVGNEIQVQMSLPFWFPVAGRRYFNAEGIARPEQEDGEPLVVRLQGLKANGRPLPRMVARQIERSRDLVETVKLTLNGHDPRDSLDDLSIQNGVLTLVTRPLPGESRRRPREGAGQRSIAPDEWPDSPFALEPPAGPQPDEWGGRRHISG